MKLGLPTLASPIGSGEVTQRDWGYAFPSGFPPESLYIGAFTYLGGTSAVGAGEAGKVGNIWYFGVEDVNGYSSGFHEWFTDGVLEEISYIGFNGSYGVYSITSESADATKVTTTVGSSPLDGTNPNVALEGTIIEMGWSNYPQLTLLNGDELTTKTGKRILV